MNGTLRDFIATHAGDGILHLTAINDRGVFDGRGFDPGDLDEAEAWVRAANEHGNAYFTVNAPGKRCRKSKLDKSHIERLRAFWADLDPDDEIEAEPAPADDPAATGYVRERNRLLALAERLPETDYPPSFVIDSGNGIQVVWLFDEPIEATDETKATVEALGKRIEAALGDTENTNNVDRVLRLPDTVNWPNAKKRAKGYTSCRARLLHAGPERYAFCDLAEIADAIERETTPELRKAGLLLVKQEKPAEGTAEIDEEALPSAMLHLLDVDDKLRRAWTKGTKLGSRKGTTASHLESALTMYLCRRLGDEDLEAVLRAYPWGQIATGKLTDKEADRRIERLLEMARTGREASKYDDTQDGIAQAFRDTYRDRLRFDHTAGAWFQFDGGIWQRDERKLAFSWCRQIGRQLGFDGKATTAAGAEKFAQSDEAFAVTHELWDADPFLLGTPAGTLDLRTGVIMGARATDFITRSTAVAPVPGPHPVWSAFLDDATRGDEGLQAFLQQIAGYGLTGDTREHALFFIHGAGGNGKSVFLNTLARVFGAYAATAAMDTFTATYSDRHPTDLAMLNGARLVTASETEDGKAWAESRIKQLTGGDPITARFMRRDFFTYQPRFKLVIIGNHKPALRNVDDAARRRFHIIPFEHKPTKPDMLLEKKLEAEWPQILWWAVQGCLDWQRNGLLKPAIVADATREYFEDQDLFSQWLGECCRVHPLVSDKSSDLFASWKAYAEARGIRPGDMKSFAEKMTRAGFKKERPRSGGAGRPMQWNGVQLLAEERFASAGSEEYRRASGGY